MTIQGGPRKNTTGDNRFLCCQISVNHPILYCVKKISRHENFTVILISFRVKLRISWHFNFTVRAKMWIGHSHYLHVVMVWIQIPSCFGVIKNPSV